MVNEVGKEIIVPRHLLSFNSSTINEIHITEPPTRLGSTNLINFRDVRSVVLIFRNVEIKTQFFRIG